MIQVIKIQKIFIVYSSTFQCLFYYHFLLFWRFDILTIVYIHINQYYYQYQHWMSTSAFKNRIPKRKYRERVQPEGRQHLGFLQKKKDYKERAKNYHRKQDLINNLKLKASTKNQDQFYFKMIKGKKNEHGAHVEDDDDSDFDEKQYRSVLKTENYNIVSNQRSIIQNKIEKLKGQLQLTSQEKVNNHKIFTDSAEEFQNFPLPQYFKTSKQLIDNNLLDVNPESMRKENIDIEKLNTSEAIKTKYNKLNEFLKRQQMLTKMLLKIGYEKNLLGKERKMIKKNKKGGIKCHKYFLERKK